VILEHTPCGPPLVAKSLWFGVSSGTSNSTGLRWTITRRPALTICSLHGHVTSSETG
jgi:hypothetical protein